MNSGPKEERQETGSECYPQDFDQWPLEARNAWFSARALRLESEARERAEFEKFWEEWQSHAEHHGPQLNGHPVAILTAASEIEIKPIDWIYRNWIARGKIHVIAGKPQTFKTTVMLSVMATISAGYRWPNGDQCPPGYCLYWSGEDSADDTLVPRLKQMGADLTRIRFITAIDEEGKKRPFSPATDLPAIEKAIAAMEWPPCFIGIDPIAEMAGKANSNANAEMRAAMQPFFDLCDRRHIAGFGVHHLTKGSAGKDPLERLTGSIAFGAVPRIVWLAVERGEEEKGNDHSSDEANPIANGESKPPHTRFLLARAKCSIGERDGAIGYDFAASPLYDNPDIMATRIVWGEEIDGRVWDIMDKAEHREPEPECVPKSSKLGECCEWLKEQLAKEPLPANCIFARGELAGYPAITVKRAKAALPDVQAYKEGKHWVWRFTGYAQSAGDRSGQD